VYVTKILIVVDFLSTHFLHIYCLGSCPPLTMGILDDDEVMVLQILQEIHENKAISFE
jgi:hypothetical protein